MKPSSKVQIRTSFLEADHVQIDTWTFDLIDEIRNQKLGLFPLFQFMPGQVLSLLWHLDEQVKFLGHPQLDHLGLALDLRDLTSGVSFV